ncbi:MAG: High-affinity nickel transporter [Acidobacteria bacterium]|nr:MAG: High-affinity nickel transporter [Acidobacteriota bacterium]PYR75013.1 MAG: High-affinity nickel transporter [Acidobacteriota bacterium]
MLLIAITGTAAGLFHVLSGPDHLAAVAPLAVQDGRRGWFAGWTWGFGHASGVVVVALLAIVLRDLLPPIDILSTWGERVVGVALIAIGLWALRRALNVSPGAHHHGPISHDHIHVHTGPVWARRLGHAHASFCMGILHGIAGSSHFLGVLPALALPTRGAAVEYIAAFGVGTIVAMTAFAAAMGSAGARVHHRAALHRGMMLTAATLAIAVGGFWLVF